MWSVGIFGPSADVVPRSGDDARMRAVSMLRVPIAGGFIRALGCEVTLERTNGYYFSCFVLFKTNLGVSIPAAPLSYFV